MAKISRSNPKFTLMSKQDRPIKFDLNKAINDFLYAKRIEKRSPRTVEAYEQTLNQFRKWHESNARVEITTEVIREYIHYLTYEKIRWDDHPTSPKGEVGLSARAACRRWFSACLYTTRRAIRRVSLRCPRQPETSAHLRVYHRIRSMLVFIARPPSYYCL